MQQQDKDVQALLNLLKGFDPQKLTDEVIRTGEDWAEQDAAASSLEETKKSMLAKLSLQYMETGHSSGAAGERSKPMSATMAEMKALADPQYEQHIDLMIAARKTAQRARVRYDMGRMKLELMRSVQATMRNEMRIASMNT